MVQITDILYYGLGAAGGLFATTYEVSLAEDQSGVNFEKAKPTAGTPFVEFSKWFMPIETGKLLGLYFVQDYIDQPILEKMIHGVMFGNVALDFLFWLRPTWYRTIVNKFESLTGA